MLKQRFLTAIFLIPIIILAIFFLPPELFLVAIGLVVLVGAWEWTYLAGINSVPLKVVYVALTAACLIALLFLPLIVLIAVGVIFWITAFILVLLYPQGTHFWSSVWMRSIMGILTLTLFWYGAIILQGFSPLLFLFMLIVIWSADAGAYFVGKKWGKRKLVPAVSPGKTVAGFIGGLLTVLIIAILGLWFLNIPYESMIPFLLICLIGGGLITVLGDLFESMLKRYVGVKDSGNLLPGHGGLLDRIDSLTPAIPFFALFLPYILA